MFISHLGIHVDMKFGALTKATLCVWEVENSSDLSLEKRKIPSVPCLRVRNLFSLKKIKYSVVCLSKVILYTSLSFLLCVVNSVRLIYLS